MCHTFLPDPHQITLQTIQICRGFITFQVQATARQANCPQCGEYSDRAHGRYVRTIQDLPWQGNPVRFQLTLRKFFCDNQNCTRKIFAQTLPKVARRYQRKTARLESILLQMLWKVGASDAHYIASLLGLILSDDALLYQFKKAPAPGCSGTSPEAIGIDDFAFLKGQSYGSILIDLKTSTPVDLLPDREKATVEKWLREHPGAKVVSRDRSVIYADAIRAGAPEAIHVADRFHLLKNMMEVLEKTVSRESKAIEVSLLPTEASSEDSGPVPLSRQQQERKERTRQKRFERWQRAHELLAQGYAKKEIARQLGVDIHTVRNDLRAAVFSERQQRYSPDKGPLAPYKEYLERRWLEGCQNALELFREVKAQGFSGGATAVRDFVRPFRDPNLPPAVVRERRAIPSPRSLAWLLVSCGKLSPKKQELVDKLCTAIPALTQGRELVITFKDMMRRRASDELDAWMERAKESGLVGFATFVRGIRADYAAVAASFSMEWSNGPTEGHVNRLKFIKRQGYGRASFDLLRRRVLPLAVSK